MLYPLSYERGVNRVWRSPGLPKGFCQSPAIIHPRGATSSTTLAGRNRHARCLMQLFSFSAARATLQNAAYRDAADLAPFFGQSFLEDRSGVPASRTRDNLADSERTACWPERKIADISARSAVG